MSVVVIHGVTGIPHHRHSAKRLSQIAVISSFGDHLRLATSVFNHSPYHSAAHTACVMPSVDSIRRESHVAARDVFQPLPTQRRLILVYHWDTINGLVNYVLPCGPCSTTNSSMPHRELHHRAIHSGLHC